MSIKDFFKPVPVWDADAVREFMDEHDPEEYNLIDVRQPKEYQSEHIPGAALVPLGELESRLEEFDPNKPTIAY
jgi:rhodanese-related sulfurtransferase